MNQAATAISLDATLRAYRGMLRNYRSASVKAAMLTAASLGRFEIYKAAGGQWQVEIVAERDNGSVLHARNCDPDARAAIDAAIIAALAWLPLPDDPADPPLTVVASDSHARRSCGEWYCERLHPTGWASERHHGAIPYGAGEGWGETEIRTATGLVRVRRVKPIPFSWAHLSLIEIALQMTAWEAADGGVAPEAPFAEVAAPEPRATAS